VTSGLDSVVGEPQAEYVPENNPLANPDYSAFINWDRIFLSLNTYKIARGYFNLVITKEVLRQVLSGNQYILWVPYNPFELNDFSVHLRLHRFAEMVLKDYLNKFYAEHEKKYLTKNLKAQLLNTSLFPELFPEDEKIILKVPKRMVEHFV
jgi:hypothetical protein